MGVSMVQSARKTHLSIIDSYLAKKGMSTNETINVIKKNIAVDNNLFNNWFLVVSHRFLSVQHQFLLSIKFF